MEPWSSDPAAAEAGEAQGNSLELLILWDVPCTVPGSSFTGHLLTRDTTHASEATSGVPSATAAPETSEQLPPLIPPQSLPAAFSTGEKLLGRT